VSVKAERGVKSLLIEPTGGGRKKIVLIFRITRLWPLDVVSGKKEDLKSLRKLIKTRGPLEK